MPRNLVSLAAACLLAAALPAQGAPASLSLQATDLNGRVIAIPAGLPAPRTLLLVGFRHSDRAALDGWRQGLALAAEDPTWLETPVIGVGSGMIRSMILRVMRSGAETPQARAHLAPAFADGAQVAAALGVDPGRPAAVVLDRGGHVLARASGDYDPAKAAALTAALR